MMSRIVKNDVNVFNVFNVKNDVKYSMYKSAVSCIVKTDVNVFNVINDTCVLAFNVFNVMVVFLRCTHSHITTTYTVI